MLIAHLSFCLSLLIGLGLCPIPAGCWKPRDCSSLLRTLITALMTACKVQNKKRDNCNGGC